MSKVWEALAVSNAKAAHFHIKAAKIANFKEVCAG